MVILEYPHVHRYPLIAKFLTDAWRYGLFYGALTLQVNNEAGDEAAPPTLPVLPPHLLAMAAKNEGVLRDVADEFSWQLRMTLGNRAYAALAIATRKSRAENGGVDPQTCHSGDVCDANILMYRAIAKCGLGDQADETMDETLGADVVDASRTAYTDLWNAAWDYAKKHDFFYSPLLYAGTFTPISDEDLDKMDAQERAATN